MKQRDVVKVKEPLIATQVEKVVPVRDKRRKGRVVIEQTEEAQPDVPKADRRKREELPSYVVEERPNFIQEVYQNDYPEFQEPVQQVQVQQSKGRNKKGGKVIVVEQSSHAEPDVPKLPKAQPKQPERTPVVQSHQKLESEFPAFDNPEENKGKQYKNNY